MTKEERKKWKEWVKEQLKKQRIADGNYVKKECHK
jgi:hypothetical protein